MEIKISRLSFWIIVCICVMNQIYSTHNRNSITVKLLFYDHKWYQLPVGKAESRWFYNVHSITQHRRLKCNPFCKFKLSLKLRSVHTQCSIYLTCLGECGPTVLSITHTTDSGLNSRCRLGTALRMLSLTWADSNYSTCPHTHTHTCIILV